MFLKENLPFDYLQDEFIRKDFFPDRESRDYVFNAPGEYYRSEKFLKLLIKKGRCKEFIACMHNMKNCHNDIHRRIRSFQRFEANTAWRGK